MTKREFIESFPASTPVSKIIKLAEVEGFLISPAYAYRIRRDRRMGVKRAIHRGAFSQPIASAEPPAPEPNAEPSAEVSPEFDVLLIRTILFYGVDSVRRCLDSLETLIGGFSEGV